MKISLKHLVFIIAFFLLAFPVVAQNLTGIWRGYFYTDGGDQYKYEVQINHKKGTLEGVTYSYLDTRFYGKATLEGSYTTAGLNATVQETKTIELKMAGGSVACIMRCALVYDKSGKEEFLEGTFTSKYEYSNPTYGVSKGANCGGGRVYLRKVPTSEFYPEPFLSKTTPSPKKEEPRINTPKPAPKSSQSRTSSTTAKKPAAKPAVTTPPAKTDRPKVDTMSVVSKSTPQFENKTINKKIATTPLVTRERKNELTKIVSVQNSEIEIRLYDNGEIDDDTISVYMNNKLIIASKRLSDKPIIYKIKLTQDEPEVTLVMVAENLGRIPPNTSLMIVQDGDKRHQVSITSTEQKNAMVTFRYQKPE